MKRRSRVRLFNRFIGVTVACTSRSTARKSPIKSTKSWCNTERSLRFEKVIHWRYSRSQSELLQEEMLSLSWKRILLI